MSTTMNSVTHVDRLEAVRTILGGTSPLAMKEQSCVLAEYEDLYARLAASEKECEWLRRFRERVIADTGTRYDDGD